MLSPRHVVVMYLRGVSVLEHRPIGDRDSLIQEAYIAACFGGIVMASVVFNGRSVRPGKVVCVGKNYAAHI